MRVRPSPCNPLHIHFQYKSALRRAHARDRVEREEEQRIRRARGAFTEQEYISRYERYLSHIPYKPLKMRCSSFTRYFGCLKRLGWVEVTGKTEPSVLRDLTTLQRLGGCSID